MTNKEKEIQKWGLEARWRASRSSTCQLWSLFILEILVGRSIIWKDLAGWLAGYVWAAYEDCEGLMWRETIICVCEGWRRESVTYLEMQFPLSVITRNFSQPRLAIILFTNNQPGTASPSIKFVFSFDVCASVSVCSSSSTLGLSQ